ncbi:diguanylate cyclase [Desulfobacter hydrogenophilus]|uniref:Diguanylate cyclase n=1 Tax=Desulfobacter hydrogenophilus TaxID=2291 RepID=A0A328F8K4_9BACT|nr:EAL domain-containing protein [Desulfobacter hydrogenophilus]NDY73678.1 EAL domain-containing protein [Desulfobacter hydrogenophilus]QBH11769.1 EAL domain-containing protein [Desulfobacter hydrogenophilus]RAM00546.1 diguanylate cyclase [Desulfobacter hydrogenophilus]
MPKRLSIRIKLFFIYSLVATAVFLCGFTIYYIHVKSHLEHQIKNALTLSNASITALIKTVGTVSIKIHLRTIAEKNLEIIDHIYQDFQDHLITEKEAKKQAANLLLSEKIGRTGYIYVIDSTGEIKVHPKQDVKGQNYAELGFIQKQLIQKNGYLEYWWKNPEDNEKHPKALHMTYFEPWDWIISASSYKLEFSQLVSVEDFKDSVLAMDILGTGYAFVCDSRANIIIHPKLTGNMMDYATAENKTQIREIIAQKKGMVRYFWKNPEDQVVKEKLMAFDFIPEFDWIIASSTYTEKAFAQLLEMRRIFFVILAASIAVIAFVSLAVSTSITRPLTRLIDHLNVNMNQGWQLQPLDSRRKDEIGDLESSFNEFVGRLETYKRNLITENTIRKETEIRLQLFEKVFENANEGITITDLNGNIQAVNQAFTDITGYSAQEAVGQNPRILKSDRHDHAFYKSMWQVLTIKGQWSGEIWNRKKSGQAYPEFLNISAIRNKNGKAKNYMAVFHDISEMKTKEKQIEYMAYHDPLTGLPNRTLLKDRLEHAIIRARRDAKMIQLIFIDLDNFKNVNDTAGHAQGDELLKEAAERLDNVTRASDTVARLGGDEFMIMVTDVDNMMEIIRMVKRIQESFSAPFNIDGKFFHVTCSIGISVFPEDGDDAETLLRHADLAMYHSKEKGRNQYYLFEQKMAKKIHQRIEMEMNMRTAIENDEFQVYFQPQVNIRTLKPVGLEALVRWIKPDGAVVLPGRFIPLAEESGLIIPIGKQILKKAVEQICRIREKNQLDLMLSVNVSARQMDEPSFEKMAAGIIKETSYPPDRLKIEITESLLMRDINTTMTRLKKLSQIGISTAIDDFGTGYSSLAYLKQMSITTLKIDKSFIDDIVDDDNALALVETIVLMASKLNMGIVAEGVEDEKQLKILNQLGDMDIQGYIFARPMPLLELECWLSEHRLPHV